MSPATCHLSPATCHLSPATCTALPTFTAMLAMLKPLEAMNLAGNKQMDIAESGRGQLSENTNCITTLAKPNFL